jgi:hypothetical protein
LGLSLNRRRRLRSRRLLAGVLTMRSVLPSLAVRAVAKVTGLAGAPLPITVLSTLAATALAGLATAGISSILQGAILVYDHKGERLERHATRVMFQNELHPG